MAQKAFRPPLLVKRPSNGVLQAGDTANQPPAKRRRITDEQQEENIEPIRSQAIQTSGFIPPRVSSNSDRSSVPSSQPSIDPTTSGSDAYYNVLWRKFTTKKHKTWESDGILAVRGGYATLQDSDGRQLGRAACKGPLLPGSTLSLGGREVEVDCLLSKADYLAGKPFLRDTQHQKSNSPKTQLTRPKHRIKVNPAPTASDVEAVPIPLISVKRAPFKKLVLKQDDTALKTEVKTAPKPQPRHNPDAPGALVMKRPISIPRGKQIVDVVVDPLLVRHLRPHQREGVQFLYECVLGLRLQEGEGAILADEMGLGKTLQTIALLWTLMKQNPIYGDAPIIKKALIVCPVTLISNWRKEIRKWLGPDRLGVLCAEDKGFRISDFTKGKSYNVMIVGYEKLRTLQHELVKGDSIDIVIADEGHRLKTAQNKSAAAIKAFSTDRRIILTGTPLQNDLSEFYTMVDFVNPGLLAKYSTFKREFETPILKSRQPSASEQDIEQGEARAEELARLTSQFILRRNADIIAQFLPPKTENVIFCRPSAAQMTLYRAVLQAPAFGAVLGSNEAALQLINLLKKLCNSPSLFFEAKRDPDKQKQSALVMSILDAVELTSRISPGASAKLHTLDRLLSQFHEMDEKVVIVSHYTQTLDILANLLNSLGYSHLRIDGQTPASKRHGLVEQFNKRSSQQCFAFLLSTKAAGIGLNLIGASRLVLFDSDWNPAHDLQAMARIHRDGQIKPCHIYRLLLQGTLDEKIYQRQLTKTGLADEIVDGQKTAQGFSREELKKLFQLDENEACATHELLTCGCEGSGNANADAPSIAAKAFGESMDDPAADDCESDDDLVDANQLVSADKINFEALERKSHLMAAKRRKALADKKLLALMNFLHIDAAKIRAGDAELELLVQDEALLQALRESGSRINFVFSRTTG